jgi:agmatine deiminase
MPAEWERHDATWIGWPHHEPDWPGKIDAVRWAYAEIVRVLANHERVEVLCQSDAVRDSAATMLRAHDVVMQRVNLVVVPTDRVWLRDSGPSFVWNSNGEVELIAWDFDAWAKYDNFERDRRVPEAVQGLTGLPMTRAVRSDDAQSRLVLEGGGIEVNGQGRILVTEEWLLSDVQVRNPGLSRAGYEQAFAKYLGCSDTIWLGRGCAGDDTHGHVDDIARFVNFDTVVLAFESDPADANHAASRDNLMRLNLAAERQPLNVVLLPYPRPVLMEGQRLPASYANFYIANDVVLVPTFNDPNDRVALGIIASVFPGRSVVGIHAVDLVWGLGTLHCLTQQQPAMALQNAGIRER